MIPKKNTDVFYVDNHQICSHYVTEIYIPDEYLDKSKSVENGTTYTVLGILPYSVFVDGSVVYSGTLKIAQMININVVEKRRDNIKLSKYMDEPSPVTALLYQPGEPITSEYSEANASLASTILNMLLGGNLPSTIPYSDVLNIIRDAFNLNMVNIPIPSFILEDMIATLYRSQKNPENKYAKDLGNNPSISPLSYRAMSYRDVTRYISTFAGMTSEVMGQALLYGIKRTKTGKEEPISAVEKTIHA